ncbi:hypothetical protein [Cellulosimicrobium sp. NPDC057127]|uniref:hypothetical protein n=1 Tax=Cellulosimicrobium sp. NPDC057127 TaxID=3346026 RepID=UPI003630C2C8
MPILTSGTDLRGQLVGGAGGDSEPVLIGVRTVVRRAWEGGGMAKRSRQARRRELRWILGTVVVILTAAAAASIALPFVSTLLV